MDHDHVAKLKFEVAIPTLVLLGDVTPSAAPKRKNLLQNVPHCSVQICMRAKGRHAHAAYDACQCVWLFGTTALDRDSIYLM